MQTWAALVIPVALVGFQDKTGRAIFTLNQPCTGERVGFHDSDTRVDRRVSLGKGEWSSAPRACCIDHSPMSFAAAQLVIAEPLSLPES